MRANVLLAVLGMLAAATPAHAAETHTLTATCSTVWTVAGPIAVVGNAEASGSVRGVSTEIICTLDSGWCCGDSVTAQQKMPGPVAVVAGYIEEPIFQPLIFQPLVCASAWAYWADGFSFAVQGRCSFGSVTAQETR